MKLSIIDYGAGNLRSITNVMDFLNQEYKIITTANEIDYSDVIILPGVGHFNQLMQHFTNNNLAEPLLNHINSGKPYLGICLGMQILFESSEEAPDTPGLGLYKGTVVRFKQGKVPQIGWNRLNIFNDSILTEDYFYFVNSYCVKTDQNDIIAATTNYNETFVSAIQDNNLLAVQFHPEKSGKAGSKVIKRWLNYVN